MNACRRPTTARGGCSSIDSIAPSRSSSTNAYCTSVFSAGCAPHRHPPPVLTCRGRPEIVHYSYPNFVASRGSSSSSYSQPNNSHALRVELHLWQRLLRTTLQDDLFSAPTISQGYTAVDSGRIFTPPTHSQALSFPLHSRTKFTPLSPAIRQISIQPPAPVFNPQQIGCSAHLAAGTIAVRTARTGHLPSRLAHPSAFFPIPIPPRPHPAIGQSKPLPPRQIAPRAHPPTCPVSPYSAHLTERGVC